MCYHAQQMSFKKGMSTRWLHSLLLLGRTRLHRVTAEVQGVQPLKPAQCSFLQVVGELEPAILPPRVCNPTALQLRCCLDCSAQASLQGGLHPSETSKEVRTKRRIANAGSPWKSAHREPNNSPLSQFLISFNQQFTKDKRMTEIQPYVIPSWFMSLGYTELWTTQLMDQRGLCLLALSTAIGMYSLQDARSTRMMEFKGFSYISLAKIYKSSCLLSSLPPPAWGQRTTFSSHSNYLFPRSF